MASTEDTGEQNGGTEEQPSVAPAGEEQAKPALALEVEQPKPEASEPEVEQPKPEASEGEQPKPEASEVEQPKPEASEVEQPKPEASEGEQPKPEAQIPMPAPVKQRYDWYQTETHVVVTILIKRAKPEDVRVDLTSRTLSATVQLPTGSEYCLELDLAHPIIPAKSNTKVLSSKIEVKLKKEEGLRWNKLEGEDPMPQAVKPTAASADTDVIHKYPTSSHVTRNWDKLAKDFDKEEEESAKGEAALNNLFQKIYENGDDETRKAMNKSFSESAGTVLSTNWTDIGKEKTEVKPPDGMEHKKWDKP